MFNQSMMHKGFIFHHVPSDVDNDGFISCHISLVVSYCKSIRRGRYRPSVPGSQVADHLPGSYDMSRFLNLYC